LWKKTYCRPIFFGFKDHDFNLSQININDLWNVPFHYNGFLQCVNYFLVNPTIVCQPPNVQWKEVNMTHNKCFNYNQISFFPWTPSQQNIVGIFFNMNQMSITICDYKKINYKVVPLFDLKKYIYAPNNKTLFHANYNFEEFWCNTI
jgi:hypothetical protein